MKGIRNRCRMLTGLTSDRFYFAWMYLLRVEWRHLRLEGRMKVWQPRWEQKGG